MGSLNTPATVAGGHLQHGRIPNPSAMIINPDHSSVIMRRRSQIAWVKRYAGQGDMVNASRVARSLGATVDDVLSGRVKNDGEVSQQAQVGRPFVAASDWMSGVTGTVANIGLFGAGWFANGALNWVMTPTASLRSGEYNWVGGVKKGTDNKYTKSTKSHVERLASMKAINSTAAALIQTFFAVQLPRWIDPLATLGIDASGANMSFDGIPRQQGSSLARTILKYRDPYLAGVWGQAGHALADRFLSRNPASSFSAFLRQVGSLGPTWKADKGADGKWTLAKDAQGRYIPDWDGFSTGYLGKKLMLDADGNAVPVPAQQQQQQQQKVGDAFSETREIWDPTVTVPPPVQIPASVGCGNAPMMQPMQQIPASNPAPAVQQVGNSQSNKRAWISL